MIIGQALNCCCNFILAEVSIQLQVIHGESSEEGGQIIGDTLEFSDAHS